MTGAYAVELCDDAHVWFDEEGVEVRCQLPSGHDGFHHDIDGDWWWDETGEWQRDYRPD